MIAAARVRAALLTALSLIVLTAAAAAQAPAAVPAPPASPAAAGPSVGGALVDSLALLGVEHGVRLAFQAKTRRELAGPFWRDYADSLHVPHNWEDDDSWIVNYIGHPIHGAAAGFVWIDHDPVSREPRIGLASEYWATRWRPLVWAAAYSFQFELGPLSEAAIGNVGLRRNDIGWVDYVVTPVGGLGLLVAEDALDRFFIEWFERHVRNRPARAVVRGLFNPARTMANVASGRLPWYRADRPVTPR
jgi:hypothetical protein